MNKETLTKYCKEYIENEKKMQELEARQKIIKARILENLQTITDQLHMTSLLEK